MPPFSIEIVLTTCRGLLRSPADVEKCFKECAGSDALWYWKVDSSVTHTTSLHIVGAAIYVLHVKKKHIHDLFSQRATFPLKLKLRKVRPLTADVWTLVVLSADLGGWEVIQGRSKWSCIQNVAARLQIKNHFQNAW